MKVIGFATEYYTLWNVTTTPNYFTDAYGNHHLQSNTTNYNYIQNISKDLDVSLVKYPGLSVCGDLKGYNHSWSKKSEKDLTPWILKFGKHIGKHLQEVALEDFGYIIYLLENGYTETKEACLDIKVIQDILAEIEIENQRKMDLNPVAESGLVEIEFLTNPSYIGNQLYSVYNSIGYDYPETMTWEIPTEDTFLPGMGNNKYKIILTSGYMNIVQRDSSEILFNGDICVDISEAKYKAEQQLAANEHKDINNYIVENELSVLRNKRYAEATIGNGNVIHVFFDDVKFVDCRYPYHMAYINGKAIKTKGKKMILDLKILHTNKQVDKVSQTAIINTK